MSFMIKFKTFDIDSSDIFKPMNYGLIGPFPSQLEADKFRTTMPIKFSYMPGSNLTDIGHMRMHCGDTVIWSTPVLSTNTGGFVYVQEKMRCDFLLNSNVIEVKDGDISVLTSDYRINAYTVGDDYWTANSCHSCCGNFIMQTIFPIFGDETSVQTVISNISFEWQRKTSANGIAPPISNVVKVREDGSLDIAPVDDATAVLKISPIVEFGHLLLCGEPIGYDVTMDEANLIAARWRANSHAYKATRIAGI